MGKKQSRTPSSSTTSSSGASRTPSPVEHAHDTLGNQGVLDRMSGDPAADVFDTATSGAGSSIPYASEMEDAFGRSFAGIDAHTGQAGAMRAIGAKAAASGSSVAFADAHPSRETVAEELAHVVQGEGGASGTGVSNASHPAELEAKAIAKNVAGGGAAGPINRPASGASVFRLADTSHVGGNYEQAITLPRAGGSEVEPGEAGYSDAMLDATSYVAEAMVADGMYSDLQMSNVLPNFSRIDNQLEIRAASKQHYIEERDGTNDFILFHHPGIAQMVNQPMIDWHDTFIPTLERHRQQTQERFDQFNAWVPRANQYFTTGARLEAQLQMIGCTSAEETAAMLRYGLEDAGQVRAAARDDEVAGGSSAAIDVPQPNETVTSSTERCQQKAMEMNTAYIRWQGQVSLATRRSAINAEGNDERARLSEIEQIKQTISQIGATVDLTMAVMAGAPKMINNVGGALQHGEAYVNAVRNNRDILNGGNGHHNPTYITNDSDGNMVIRNVQTGQDRNALTGERSDMGAAPSVTIPGIPTSAQDILNTLTDWVYADEVRALNSALAQISTRAGAVETVMGELNLRAACDGLRDTINAYAVEAQQLQRAAQQRRLEYLNLGVQLDNYARQSETMQEEGLAPGEGAERYATIMSLTASVREMLLVGRSAKSMIYTPAQFEEWFLTMKAQREVDPPGSYMRQFSVGEVETARANEIFGQLSQYHGTLENGEETWGEVDATAASVFDQMNAGPDSGAY